MFAARGCYSNAHRGKIGKRETALFPPPLVEEEPTYVPSRGWAEMIKKVYETGPLRCPSYEGQMRIISYIEEQKVIDMIVRYLKLTFEAGRLLRFIMTNTSS